VEATTRKDQHGTTKVLIAGGGVAALEALLALRDLAEERVSVELLCPRPEFSYRPLAVAEPFGLGKARSYDLARIAADHKAALHTASLAAVEPGEHCVRTDQGGVYHYDLLVVAVGARMETALKDAIMVRGPGYTGRFRALLEKLDRGEVRQVTFAVPPGSSWPLPLYELALMTAARVSERGLTDVELRLVTPERAALELFGSEASHAVSSLLAERGVELLTGLYPSAIAEGALVVVPGEHPPVPAEQVVAMPKLVGPGSIGLPHDADGFIPVDLHGLVRGEADVYAAGDGTTFPIKQGGIATQQADAVAEAIAARVGVPIAPEPFRPVLRGMLLTGASPRYMRAEISGGRGERWDVADHALWWPPSKIVGRYLSPYLAVHHDEIEVPPSQPGDVAVELELDPEPPRGGA
jgi:sulfide:quinone oxidoreductase